MWVASGSFSQFSISHRLLQRGKGYEAVKCGDQAKLLKLLKSQIAINLWKYYFQVLKNPLKNNL